MIFSSDYSCIWHVVYHNRKISINFREMVSEITAVYSIVQVQSPNTQSSCLPSTSQKSFRTSLFSKSLFEKSQFRTELAKTIPDIKYIVTGFSKYLPFFDFFKPFKGVGIECLQAYYISDFKSSKNHF